jgi:hypothetical protein
MTPGLLRRGMRVVSRWSPEERDAILYSASALFALCTAQFSGISLYQQWGRLAVGPYVTGAVASAAVARSARPRRASLHSVGSAGAAGAAGAARSGPGGATAGERLRAWTTPRLAIFLVVMVGATLIPLSLEVLWRTDSGPGTAHVQPETLVVEHAGQCVVHGCALYTKVNPKDPPPAPPGQPAYDVFNPYLPLMSVFGLAAGTDGPRRLTDARIGFSVFTVLVVALALGLCRGPSGPRVLTLQAMTVLPTAALPLATGGDDVPVAALMLLGLVLLQRRRPLGSGVAIGVAAAMKITAWPLALIAILAARDAEGERSPRARLWFGLGVVGVLLPAVLPSFLDGPSAFIDNVVRFPLGLAGMTSPAASPLIGHAVVTAFPHLQRAFTLLLAVGGSAVLGFVLVRHTPRTAAEVARLLAWAFTAAILLAPATRIGYALYPVEFFVWAWLLRSEERFDARRAARARAAELSPSRRRRTAAA